MRDRVFQFLLLLTIWWIVDARRHGMRFTKSVGTEITEAKEKKYLPEDECSAAGGICIEKDNCPAGKISRVGKCPKQSDAGAVCCHSVGRRESRCRNLGGSCMDNCSETLKKPQARDCAPSQHCCILI